MSVLLTCINAYLDNKKIVFFGAGQYSILTIKNLRSQIAYFCDNAPSKQGTSFGGIPVYGPQKLLEENRAETVIVINTEFYQEISKQLFDMGFTDVFSRAYKNGGQRIPEVEFDSKNTLQRKAAAISSYNMDEVKALFEDNISQATFDAVIDRYKRGSFDFSGVCTRDPIYFNNIFLGDMNKDEVYVDAGAYDGKTLVDFILFTKNTYKKIYAFEPDLANYALLSAELQGCQDVIIERAALSCADGTAIFDMRGTQSSRLVSVCPSESNLNSVETVKLDSYIEGEATFIKMDIEGGEYDALIGSRRLIQKYRPKLAISVYHNDADLIKIPLLLHELVPEYKFYLRHHTPINVDTILYAKI